VLNRPTFLCAGLEYRYRIRVTNSGPGPWPALGDARGVGGVRLSYHWLESVSQRVLSEGTRSSLRDDLPPGGAATLEASVHAPARPGRYTLVFSMVQEGVAWLEDAGPRARSRVSVERCWGRFHDGPGSDLRPPGRRDARSP
jgi:hypothetical protein